MKGMSAFGAAVAAAASILILGMAPVGAAEDPLRCKLVPGDACPWGHLEKAQLDGKDLSDSSYKAVDLHEASLKKAELVRVNFQTANATKADFTGAHLQSSTFFAANAAAAKFDGADLTGVNFTRADLTGASLKGAKLDKMTFFIHAKLDGATWVDGRTCAPGSLGECK